MRPHAKGDAALSPRRGDGEEGSMARHVPVRAKRTRITHPNESLQAIRMGPIDGKLGCHSCSGRNAGGTRA